jgi:NADH:ubiquinone oxidoreductase subunit 4 (subunit M)
MFNRLCFGVSRKTTHPKFNIKIKYKNYTSKKKYNTSFYTDLTKKEFFILTCFLLPSIYFGIFPAIFSSITENSLLILVPYKKFIITLISL